MSPPEESETDPEAGIVYRLGPGARVGDYRILAEIGRGGMGTVYLAEQPEIGKKVAIKVLAADSARGSTLERFRREALAVNQIEHPNIVNIFAFGELPSGAHYLVMEYLEGRSLHDRLRDGTALEPPEIGEIGGAVLSALGGAHDAGIVHRDLKPDNIFLVETPHHRAVKLLDFGIAKLLDTSMDQITSGGIYLGTPIYMAPEQWEASDVGPWSDIYSFGAVLYELATGRRPFVAAELRGLMVAHTSKRPPPPSSFAPMSPALERLILDCLEKRPADRPSSAGLVAERLRAALLQDADRTRVRAVALPTLVKGAPVVETATPTASRTVPGYAAGSATTAPPSADLTAPPRRSSKIAVMVTAGVLIVGFLSYTVARHQASQDVPVPRPVAPIQTSAPPAPVISHEPPAEASPPAPDPHTPPPTLAPVDEPTLAPVDEHTLAPVDEHTLAPRPVPPIVHRKPPRTRTRERPTETWNEAFPPPTRP